MPKDVLNSPRYIKKSWIAILSRFIFDPVKLETRYTVAVVTIATISILLTTHSNTKLPYLQLTPTQLHLLLLHSNLFRVSLFTPSLEVPMSFKSFFMIFSHARQGQPPFYLALDGWLKRTIFGNLSTFICRMCPNHLNLSFIIALESGTEPHFSYSLLFVIRSVSQVPRTI